MLELTVKDFALAFDAPPEDEAMLAEEVQQHEFKYERLSQQERDDVILGVLQRIDQFTRVGAHRHDVWSRSWGDVADRYDESGADLASLDPPFIGASTIIRLGEDYARTLVPRFELNWFKVFRGWLFRTYLQGIERIFEFGCGSGFNLAALAQMYPNKQLVGLDWAEPAIDLVNRVGRDHGLSLKGKRFDFFEPEDVVTLGPDSAVLTFCALEQTGDQFHRFGEWLLKAKPDLVIQMEPIVEFYDRDRLYDYLVVKYHRHREYLSGYFPWLTALEREGRAEVLCARRLRFGSLYHEGYSLLVWRPVPGM